MSPGLDPTPPPTQASVTTPPLHRAGKKHHQLRRRISILCSVLTSVLMNPPRILGMRGKLCSVHDSNSADLPTRFLFNLLRSL